MSDNVLEMRGISKAFFNVTVLHDVNLEIRRGEVHALLGENGAGKSTLIKILSGAYHKDAGEIIIDGDVAEINNPIDGLEAGVSVIYQEFNLVPHMTIYENMFLGKEAEKKWNFLDRKRDIKRARETMDRIGLRVDPRTTVSELSVAQKQMVEIAKAISEKSKILVLDEPTAAITESETKKLFEIIRQLQKEGIGIIYISHRMEELFEIADRCTVLRDGEYVATVNMDETDECELTRMMVGRDVTFEPVERACCDNNPVVLKVEGLNYRGLLKDINFELRKGEILGISGLVGSGRTELAKCLIGAYTMDSGAITLNDRPLKNHNVGESIKRGIVYLSEDRKGEGLIQIHDYYSNVALPNYNKYKGYLLKQKTVCTDCDDFISKLRIRIANTYYPVQNLSGGNQQKVVIAKWLLSDADVYIFDEPTRGIDVGAREEIYKIMTDLVERGASIIMISSDLVEVLKMSSRILVMSEGRIVANLPNTADLTQEEIIQYSVLGESRNEKCGC